MNLRTSFSVLLLTQLVSLGVAIGSPNYYQIVAKDYRRCAAPRCGGYFIKDGEAELTECSDGNFRESCYVSALVPKDQKDEAKLQRVLANNQLLHSILIVGDLTALDDNLDGTAILLVRDLMRP